MVWLHLDLMSGTRTKLRAARGRSRWTEQLALVLCANQIVQQLEMAFISSPWPSHLTSQLTDQGLHCTQPISQTAQAADFQQTLKIKMEKSNANVYNINNSLSQQTQIERTGWSQAEWVGNIRMLLPKTNYRSYSKGTLTCYDGYFQYD